MYDVIIIGSGQAGLSMGYYLKKTALSFVIIDQNTRIGDTWRNRYDSLTLFTLPLYSSLPGLRLKKERNCMPTKDDIADYLENYAKTFSLPVQLGIHVKNVSKIDDFFSLETNKGVVEARTLVVATGPFHTPRIPSFSKKLSKDIVQLHSSSYKNPSQLKDGNVLVVGAGNSGAQIAVELANTPKTYLSTSGKLRFLPLFIMNKNIFWWFDKIGILKATRDSFIGRKLQLYGDPIFRTQLKTKMKAGLVHLRERTKTASENEVIFADASPLKVDNIIWATGFRPNYDWLNLPNLVDKQGNIIHKRGITQQKGVFFLGLPWQYRRGSSLLEGVGKDAYYLYQHILTHIR
ncbi:flavin-containing monooxygenase [Priestia endophytica]|uniref:flavin-containing monooxygenase n=1 Tax=Priestia endophytica TaxID=135735 RepID=UPI000DCA6B06|nr:NAD(P)-binding domain-containing protein [Priestia endophytica]RAS80914.1 oxidoreductase [Priestia endophytica]